LEEWLSWVDKLSADHYVVIDRFLNEEGYQALHSFFTKNQHRFLPAGIGALEKNAVEREIRGDRTYWLDRSRDTELEHFWTLVDETIAVFNRYCFLSLSGYEFHLADYPPGGHYAKHVDQFQGRNNRMISMVIYLNETWQPGDGGELELDDAHGNTLMVEPVAGRCVLFKSDCVPHAVKEAHKHRHSVTGWLLYQPAALGKFLG
jgi:SM-20-related protein